MLGSLRTPGRGSGGRHDTKVTCLNDYRSVALTSVAMKCFERVVMAHINTIIPETLDALQFCIPLVTDPQITQSLLHSTLPFPTWTKGTPIEHLRDYSLVFNTIVPSKLITKLRTPGLNTSLCNWILDFLTGRPQVVRVGNNTSTMLILNTGAPQSPPVLPVHS